MSEASDLQGVLRAHLADPASSWSIGGWGAIAEFHWRPGERPPHDPHRLEAATDAGALRISLREDVVPFAYQNLSRHPHRWLQGIGLCLPWRRAQRPVQHGLTELGNDDDAVRAEDRRGVLFDLGLGLPHVQACIRSRSPDVINSLRAHLGESLLAPRSAAMALIKAHSPHRVFVSALGRVEVFQRIGSPDAQPPTPLGPHTHVLPRLLAARRANAESNDAPSHHRACAYLYPAHPLMDNLGNDKGYMGALHARFDALMRRWGDADFLAEKRRAADAMRATVAARDYRPPEGRQGRVALRVAIRELAQQLGETPTINEWRRRFDRVRPPPHAHAVH